MKVDDFAKMWFKLSRDYHQGMEAILGPSLTEGQLIVIEYILTHKQVKASDLIEYLSTTPAAVTTLLDRMVKNGLVRRERNQGDRRIVWIKLTDKGYEEGRRGIELRNRYLERALQPISRHNQKLLVYLLNKIELDHLQTDESIS